MPLREYGPCPVCGRITEVISYGDPPDTLKCAWCEEGVDCPRMFSIIAKPSTIHHMGKVDPLSGFEYTTSRELSAHYESIGAIHSSDWQNVSAKLDDQAHDALTEAKVASRMRGIDFGDHETMDEVLKDSPKFQRIEKSLEGATERAYEKAQKEHQAGVSHESDT